MFPEALSPVNAETHSPIFFFQEFKKPIYIHTYTHARAHTRTYSNGSESQMTFQDTEIVIEITVGKKSNLYVF